MPVVPVSVDRYGRISGDSALFKGICSDVPLRGPATELNSHDRIYDIGRCFVAECHEHCLTVVVVVVVVAASKRLM